MREIFLKILILITINLHIVYLHLDTSDCGITSGCWRYPSGCIDHNCFILFKWINLDTSIKFELQATISDEIPLEMPWWLAIGFSQDRRMGDDNSIICNSKGEIGHFFNPRHATPFLLDVENPLIGLSEIRVELNETQFLCSFLRAKRDNSLKDYFDLNESYFILTALGSLRPNGQLVEHRFKRADSVSTDFSIINSIFEMNNEEDEDNHEHDDRKAVAHGCLMIIAWILFASNGMILSRYFKDLLESRQLCGTQVWFAFHRPLMISTFILALSAFIIILSDENWKWIEKEETLEFIHSLFGIIALSLAILQIIVAMFRCKKDNCYRFIFNYMHSTFGITIYTLTMVSMFLGLAMNRMNLSSYGYLILIGWMIWLFILFVCMEFIEYYLREEKKVRVQDESVDAAKTNFYSFDILEARTKSKIPVLKFMVLVIHFFTSLGFTIALLYLIVDKYVEKLI